MKVEQEPRERLLADLVREDAAMALYEGELRRLCEDELLRRRRRRRLVRLVPLAAAALVLVAAGFFRWLRSETPLDGPGTGPALRTAVIVSTVPFPRDLLVQTRAGLGATVTSRTTTGASLVVRSRIDPLAVVHTGDGREDGDLALVHTADYAPAPRLGDGDLLALLGETHVALVDTGPGRAHLVFFNPDDEARLMAH